MLEPRGNAAMMRHQRRDATFREPTARVHRPPHGQPGSFFTLQTEACDPEASCECGCGVWVEGTRVLYTTLTVTPLVRSKPTNRVIIYIRNDIRL